MQFDADHLLALSGHAVADRSIMTNHLRNGIPAIAEREYGITIDLLRLFNGDESFAWLVEKLKEDARKLSRAVSVYMSNPEVTGPKGTVQGVVLPPDSENQSERK